MFRRFAAFLLVILTVATGLASPPQPAAPDTYTALLRYEIFAYRSERVRQYRELLKTLADVGFVRDPDEIVPDDEPDNPKATRMHGTLPAKNVDRLLREPHVRSLLLYPRDAKLPDKGGRVRVDLRLPSGYLPETQRRLARQTADVLANDAGFVEAIGYDHQSASRLVGSVPAAELEKLLEDVRKLPSAEGASAPLARVSPVRVAIARPDWPVPASRVPSPPVPGNLLKFTPDLRTLLAGADAAKRTRMEVILGWTPDANDRGWQRLVEVAGGVVEGRIGPLVAVLGVPKEVAPKLAESPVVAHVRLPRSGKHVVEDSSLAAPAWEPLRASGLVKLHALGRRGKDTRVAVIADDFTGWEKLKGRTEKGKALPDPVLLDLTAERNSDLQPDPFPSKGGEGYGTRCARSLLRAAPEAEVTLIRIDAHAPYMLQSIARAINCESQRTISLEQRLAELNADRIVLDRRAEELSAERRRILEMPSGDDEGLKLQKEYRERRDAFEARENAYEERRARYFSLYRDLQRLKGIRLVASTLVWTDGYPVDGSSALSRYFDDRPFKAALWFQAAGDSGGQAWAGEFRDDDGNGVLEFLRPKKPMLPAGSWSSELNFLRWQPARGAAERGLPANARLRLTLQWREAHDPLPLRVGDDVYREPLTRLNPVVVYQPDPDGKTRPADDLEIVATPAGPPTRLNQTLNSATYEQVVDLTVARPGRYAVFVEGKLPDGITALGEATLPATRKVGEVRPRLFVQTLAGPGRAVWSDFSTAQGALGMPADAQRVLAVGAADESDKARPSSATGAPAGLKLLTKPDVFAYDEGGGTGEAASFAAGFAASAWPVGGTLFGVLERMRITPGSLLRVPQRR